MKDEYAIVGPAIFVLEAMPEMAKRCIHASDGRPVEPEEVWIEVHSTWLRLDGSWISGWRGDEHFGFRPHWLNRWKIRRAARAWRKAQAGTTNYRSLLTAPPPPPAQPSRSNRND